MHGKNLLLVLSLIFCAIAAHAQTFTTLATDPQGDDSFGHDMKALSYRINQSADSIWIKIDTYYPMPVHNDMGEFIIGIDTDMITTNGTPWPGHNTSMNYDKLITIDFDGFNDTLMYITSDLNATLPATVQRNTFSFTLGFKMSDIDLDGNFNVIAGNSIPGYYYSSDDIPDTGYGKVRRAPSAIPLVVNTKSFAVYPNPTTTEINWSFSSHIALLPDEGYITDVTGRVLQTFHSGAGHADVHALAAGNYIIHIGANSAIFNKN